MKETAPDKQKPARGYVKQITHWKFSLSPYTTTSLSTRIHPENHPWCLVLPQIFELCKAVPRLFEFYPATQWKPRHRSPPSQSPASICLCRGKPLGIPNPLFVFTEERISLHLSLPFSHADRTDKQCGISWLSTWKYSGNFSWQRLTNKTECFSRQV